MVQCLVLQVHVLGGAAHPNAKQRGSALKLMQRIAAGFEILKRKRTRTKSPDGQPASGQLPLSPVAS